MKPRRSKRLKIGLVCPYNIFIGGGVQECTLALQAELTRRGHTAKIITPQPRGHDGVAQDHILLVGGSTNVRSPFQHTTAQVAASVDIDAMEEMLEREKFDVLHFHEPWVPILSRQILMRSRALNVATFHAKLPETVVSRTIERVITPYTKSVMQYLDVLTAVSPAAAEYVASLETGKDIHIIPNGIDLKKYHPTTAKSSADKNILYIGRLEKRKGVRYLLEAFHHLSREDPRVRLLIAGNGPEREKLEEMVALSGTERVTFLGFVSEADKCRLLDEATLFCSPALYGESFGIVLLESMAKGVVTVAGDNPGYESVMQDTGRLSLVNPKDTLEFTRRLALLLDDKDLRRTWQKWAASYVLQFDYAKIVDQYEAIYLSGVRELSKSMKPVSS